MLLEEKKFEDWIHTIYRVVKKSCPKNDSLTNGSLGKSLFFLCYTQYIGSDVVYEEAFSLLKQVIKNVGNKEYGIHYSSGIAKGLSGIGLMLDIITESDITIPEDIDVLDIHAVISDIIYKICLQEIQRNDLDPLHSSIGGVLYLIRSYQTGIACKGKMETLSTALMQRIVSTKVGLTLINNRNQKSAGIANIGLAHGMTGIIICVLELFKVGIHSDLWGKYIPSLIEFILSGLNRETLNLEEYLYPRAISILSNSFSRTDYQVNKFSAMGWCYGDLSIAYMLLRVDNVFSRNMYSDSTKKILESTVKRKHFAHHQVDSSIFCHGSSGIALLFDKCFALTREPILSKSRNYWLEETFKYLEDEIQKPVRYNNAYNLLQGLAGTGMVLMSLKNRNIINWERAFLL